MSAPHSTPRQEYQEWVEEQIDDHKSALSREELLALADEAVEQLFTTPDGQYPLTEILLRDAVDALLMRRLGLPDFRQWRNARRSDTVKRPMERTDAAGADGGKSPQDLT
ncbi:MAG: hypothetical protein WEB88_01625 [Gemmatimonadota bacterium]